MKKTLLALIVATGFSQAVNACTGITLATTSNDHIQARTIEWGHSNLNSKLIIAPRNYSYTSTMPDQKQGLTWTSKYGFAGISVSNDKFIAEGINETGLTAGLFYFRGYGSLATYDPEKTANNITDMDFVRWMLSQYSTVAEVEAALSKIKIVTVYFDADGQPSPTAHWRVSDKQGNSIVIEIMDHGKINIYNNTAKVLTNSPDYNWQVTNLNNYINLHPGISKPQQINGVTAQSFGVGSNFVGLPGDISPPSRFVRAAFYVNSAPVLKTAQQAVSQAFHILNNFDIPIGSEFNDKAHIPDLPSATQWTSVIDQNNGDLYYKTMYNSTIRRVDLASLNFNAKQEYKQPLDSGTFNYQDVVIK